MRYYIYISKYKPPFLYQYHRPFGHWKPKESKDSLLDTKMWLLRQKILLRGEMIRQRTWKIQISPSLKWLWPLPRLHYSFSYTLSNLCGHFSFIALALSYLENDFVSLRLYAISGISLSILFQYYRPIPLWIPISWNTLFLLINTIMILILIKEQNDARNIPIEQLEILQEIFNKHGNMSHVDFLHLISLARRHIIHQGDKLVSISHKNDHIHLVKQGRLDVIRDNQIVGKILAKQFVGAMSFLSWENKRDLQVIHDDTSSSSSWNIWSTVSYTNDKLPDHIEEVGKADVICSSNDTIIYSWEFESLHEFLHANPTIGMIFEKCISSDLNEKMMGTWNEEVKLRYHEILVSVLLDGYISDNKKMFLKNYRSTHHINKEEHESLLLELGWSIEEYELGLKCDACMIPCIKTYDEQLKGYLHTKTSISLEDKRLLLQYRQQYKISSDIHVFLVKKYGWSIDAYDMGMTIGSKTLQQLEQQGDSNDTNTSANTNTNIGLQSIWKWWTTSSSSSSSKLNPSDTSS